MAKIVIDIPKFVYDMTKAQKKVIDADAEIVGKAIIEGTVLPNDATNGDVIRAAFPKAEVIEKRAVVMVGISRMIVFDLDWWNAPYKEVENESKK